jgi:hypothetical protein
VEEEEKKWGGKEWEKEREREREREREGVAIGTPHAHQWP